MSEDEEETIESFVERERRGAIWEDALREMSISQATHTTQTIPPMPMQQATVRVAPWQATA